MSQETTPDLSDAQRGVDTVKEVLFRLENGLVIRREHVRHVGVIAKHWSVDRGEEEGYDKYLHRILNKIGESR